MLTSSNVPKLAFVVGGSRVGCRWRVVSACKTIDGRARDIPLGLALERV